MTSAAAPSVAGATHDPAEFVRELAEQQASSSRRLRMLVGAGASLAAGYPTLRALGDAVLVRVRTVLGSAADAVFDGRDLEAALTRTRQISVLLEGKETFSGLSSTTARDLETHITQAIVAELSAVVTATNPYEAIAAWSVQSERSSPVEIFTLNYDLALENALDQIGAPYFDGFSGTLRARFRADLVDGTSTKQLPAFMVRLWKLHGSMNWEVEGTPGDRAVVRTTVPAGTATAAIYPSEEKYEASRRTPFVVLHDRLRRALDEPESLLIVAGYSFGDQHLNEVVFDAALRNPRSSIVVFCHGRIPDELAGKAAGTKNLTVASREECIWGGRRGAWASSSVAGVAAAGKLELADFPVLAKHLAQNASAP